jgi:nickel-dependent lactate racemase
MKSRFSFGKSEMEVSVPDNFDCHEIRSRTAPALEDEVTAIHRSLDGPISCEPLVALAAGKKTAAISVCDITRPAPNRLTLPPLLERLQKAGIPVDGITILIATGLHRAATEDEVNAILGPEITATYSVVSHDARAIQEHLCLGTTHSGRPYILMSDLWVLIFTLHWVLSSNILCWDFQAGES